MTKKTKTSTRSAAKTVHVSVSDEALEEFDRVLEASRRAGLRVTGKPARALGTFSGRIHPDRVAQLRQIPGVAAVEPEREVSVPPPDRDVQ